MRIAVGAMMHESNTFTSIKTSLADFNPVSGEEVYRHPNWKTNSAAGMISTLQSEGVDIVPTLFARAQVSGAVNADAYAFIKEGIVEGVRKESKLDGICLALHGSMYVEGNDDPEGDLLSSLREIVGPDIPIVCALDMHTTLTPKMAEMANAFTLYRTAPHVDTFETGERAARLLLASIRENRPLAMEYVRIPMLVCGEQSETAVSPMKDMIELVQETERLEFVLSADYLLGFPWADTRHHSVSAIAVGYERNRPELREAAERLAARFWERRREFTYSTEAYPLEEALVKAMEDPRQPVIISDTGDNPTAGASEDLTLALQKLIEMGIGNALFAVVADPRARRLCAQAGIGAAVKLELGRTEPSPDSPPLKIEAKVVRLQTAQEIECAVVETSGITVIITGGRTAVYDPDFLTELGIHPNDYKIIIVKSGYLSPEYQAIAARKLFALTPGDTNIDIANIPYKLAPRPIYPLDPDVEWSV